MRKVYIAFEILIPDDILDELEYIENISQNVTRVLLLSKSVKGGLSYINPFTGKWEYIEEPK